MKSRGIALQNEKKLKGHLARVEAEKGNIVAVIIPASVALTHVEPANIEAFKKRADRPQKGSRTYLGELRKTITLRADQIEAMEEIRKIKKVGVKDVYMKAIDSFIKESHKH